MKKSSRFQVSSFKLIGTGMVICLLLIGSCNSATKKTVPTEHVKESGTAKFVFSEEIHNFGSLNAGEIVSYTFVFRNEGTKSLIITGSDSGCGCTQVIIPEKTVAPGMEGRIEIIYNSAGEAGKQLKIITLFSNAEQTKMKLFIKANVTNKIIEIYS